MTYSIAGFIVEMNVKYEPLLSQIKKYECLSENIDVQFTISDEQLISFKNLYPMLTIGECEYMLYCSKFYNYLINKNGLLIHSSCVAYNGYCYLFSAPSGTGKSTHTQLWLEKFKDAKILNDDKPAVLIEEDGIYACGTPFSGKSDLSINEKYPVKAIIFLNRGEKNIISKMPDKEVIYNILSQTVRPNEEKYMDLLLSHIENIIKKVNVYKLYCNISLEAVDVVYNYLNGEHNE